MLQGQINVESTNNRNFNWTVQMHHILSNILLKILLIGSPCSEYGDPIHSSSINIPWHILRTVFMMALFWSTEFCTTPCIDGGYLGKRKCEIGRRCLPCGLEHNTWKNWFQSLLLGQTMKKTTPPHLQNWGALQGHYVTKHPSAVRSDRSGPIATHFLCYEHSGGILRDVSSVPLADHGWSPIIFDCFLWHTVASSPYNMVAREGGRHNLALLVYKAADLRNQS